MSVINNIERDRELLEPGFFTASQESAAVGHDLEILEIDVELLGLADDLIGARRSFAGEGADGIVGSARGGEQGERDDEEAGAHRAGR